MKKKLLPNILIGVYLTLQQEMNENQKIIKGLITIYSLLKHEAEVGIKINHGPPAIATSCVLVHVTLTNFIKSKNLYWLLTLCINPCYTL